MIEHCATFNNLSAFRNHYIEIDATGPIDDRREKVVCQQVFGPSFFSLYPCKTFDEQISAFKLEKLGTLSIDSFGHVRFDPCWEGMTPDPTLERNIEGLEAFGACFCPGLPLRDYFVRLLVIPKGRPRVKDGVQYTGIGDVETANKARHLMNVHFAHNTFELCPLNEVGNKRCLMTIVNNGQNLYFLK